MIGFTSRCVLVAMLLCCITLSCNAVVGSDAALPSRAERLRGLAEVWGIAHYFHPALDDPTLQDAWRTAAMHAMAAVDAAETTEEYARALQKLVAYLGDSATEIVWTEDLGNLFLPPIRLQYIDGRTIVRSIGDEALAHLVGMELLEVDGQSVAAFLDEMWPYAPGETDVLKREWIYDELLVGPGGETHRLLFASSDGDTTSQTMSVETATDLAARHLDYRAVSVMVNERVLWAKIPSLLPFESGGEHYLENLWSVYPPASIYDAESVILDLRTKAYPFSTAPLSFEFLPQLIQQFVPSGGIRTAGTRARMHRGHAPADWQTAEDANTAGWRVENGTYVSSGYARDLPIVCLVDAESYAAVMPYIAPLIEAGMVVVIGEQFGAMPVKDTYQHELPGGLSFIMRQSVPDTSPLNLEMVLVEPSSASGVDPALDMAIETIANWDERGDVAQTAAPQLGAPLLDGEFAGWTHGQEATRLFQLFELWNAIRYFYAFPEMIDGDWCEALETSIEALDHAEAHLDYARVIQDLLVHINDENGLVLAIYLGEYATPLFGRGMLINAGGELMKPAFEVAKIEGATVTTSLLRPVWTEAGTLSPLPPGQVILGVNGVPIEEVLEDAIAMSPGARMEYRVYRAHDLAQWDIGDEVLELRIRNHDDEEMLVKVIGRHQGWYSSETADEAWWIENDIAYLNVCALELGQYREIADRVRAAAGLVIDLRGDLSSGMLTAIANLVLSGTTPYLNVSIPVRATPNLSVQAWEMTRTELVALTPERFEGPIVVLTDVSARDSAERLCMLLQDNVGATLVGETTSGSNGYVTEIEFPFGHVTFEGIRFSLGAMFSSQAIHHVDGRPLQGIGINPDVEVRPSIQGIREGRDEVLEKGLEVLQEMMRERETGS